VRLRFCTNRSPARYLATAQGDFCGYWLEVLPCVLNQVCASTKKAGGGPNLGEVFNHARRRTCGAVKYVRRVSNVADCSPPRSGNAMSIRATRETLRRPHKSKIDK
jgi:hypothetical protein